MSEMAISAKPVSLGALFAPAQRQPPASNPEADRKRAFAAGRAAADADWQPRLDALEAALQTARDEADLREANALAGARSAALALEATYAAELARLALQIAGQVLEAQPFLPLETLAALIREALSAANPGDIGTLTVHPAGIDLARSLLPAGWALAADPALAAGEALAEAGPQLAIAGLSTRLAAVAARLETAT